MSIDISESREHIKNFLYNHGVGVLATADKAGRPHAATIYITHDDQLNFYFVTKKETQKYRNLETTHQAAIAIYDPASQATVQAEGKVEEVTSAEQTERVFYEIWNIALKTSDSGVLPVSKLKAGGYVVYRLSAPSVRLASFNNPDPSDYENMFEIVT